MFSTGFKYFIGVTVLSVVALVMSLFVLDQLAIAGVALSMLIGSTALLAGIAVVTRDGQTKTSSPELSKDLTTQSIWPLVTSVGVVLLALGLVISSLVFSVALSSYSRPWLSGWSNLGVSDHRKTRVTTHLPVSDY